MEGMERTGYLVGGIEGGGYGGCGMYDFMEPCLADLLKLGNFPCNNHHWWGLR